MKLGSLGENHLKRAVLNNRKHKEGNLSVGPGIGNDYARIENIITADGVGRSPEAAWIKAWGNFTCSLGDCLGARITCLIPEAYKESQLSEDMKQVERLSEEFDVQMMGGHCEVCRELTGVRFAVTLAGYAADWEPSHKNAAAGHALVMVGTAGTFGAGCAVQEASELLQQRFSAAFLADASNSSELSAVKKLYDCLKQDSVKEHIFYLHDISCGGVYGALWQLGVRLDRGFLVDNKAIPVRQSTIEISEALNCNPYLLDGTGGMLLVCTQGRNLCEMLRGKGLCANVIGRITEGKERLIRLGPDDVRTLGPVDGDEFLNCKKTKYEIKNT